MHHAMLACAHAGLHSCAAPGATGAAVRWCYPACTADVLKQRSESTVCAPPHARLRAQGCLEEEEEEEEEEEFIRIQRIL